MGGVTDFEVIPESSPLFCVAFPRADGAGVRPSGSDLQSETFNQNENLNSLTLLRFAIPDSTLRYYILLCIPCQLFGRFLSVFCRILQQFRLFYRADGIRGKRRKRGEKPMDISKRRRYNRRQQESAADSAGKIPFLHGFCGAASKTENAGGKA